MPNNIHVNQALTDFATGYKNALYVADKVCPDIPVDFDKDTFYKLRRADVSTPLDDIIASDGEVSEIDYEQDTDTYVCIDRGNACRTRWKEQHVGDPVLDIQRRKISLILNNLLLRREIRVADLLDTAGSYASANQIPASGTGWTDTTNGDPIKDMQSAIAAMAPGADGDTKLVAVFALELWQEAQRHPKLLGLLGADDRGLVSNQAFMDFFELDEMYVSKAQKNTAARGTAATYARIWDTDKVRLLRVPTMIPSPETSMFSGRFVLQVAELGGSQQAALSGQELRSVSVTEWLDPSKGLGNGVVMNKATLSESDPKVLQNDMGAIITGA